MCRFGIILSKKPVNLNLAIKDFSRLSKENPAPDGDKQEDGWGVIYNVKNKGYSVFKSTLPIWEDNSADYFDNVFSTQIFLHSRSATFASQKNRLDLNQPFFSKNFIFVFNGRIGGVKMPFKVEGNAGSERILNLIETFFSIYNNLEKAILKTVELLKKHSKKIYGLNFSLFFKETLFTYSYFEEYEDYYKLYYWKKGDFIVVSSAGGILSKNCFLNSCFREIPSTSSIPMNKVIKISF